MRHLIETKGLQDILVYLDAKAGSARQSETISVDPRLDGEHDLIVEPLILGRRPPDLEPREVRYRDRHMSHSGQADRADRVMRHEVYVVRLGQAGDLHRLR